MSRWQAASIHLVLSIVIATALFALVFFLWYPAPYFTAAGARFLWFLLVGIDVVIGPLLTLLIFKQGKPGLKFDLTFIACAQLIALIYGFSVIAEARPTFVVFAVDRFNVVQANYIVEESLEKAEHPQFSRLSWTGPVLAAAQLPEDRERARELMFTALQGYDVENFPEFYVPYEDLAEKAVMRGKPLSRLIEKHPDQKEQIEDAIADLGKSMDEVLFLPMTATRHDMSMIIDAESGEVLTALAVDPWGV